MNIRASALAAFLALSCISVAAAEEAKPAQTNEWPGMMGGGWGGGMMGGGWGGGMMGGGWGQGMMGRGFGPGYMGGCGMMGYRRGAQAADYETYTEGRIAFLKAELKITDAQSTVWNDYADALRANSQAMASMHKQMIEAFQQKDRSMTQMFDFRIQAMRSRLAALEALKPATDALYKALSPEQQQRANEILPVMGCM